MHVEGRRSYHREGGNKKGCKRCNIALCGSDDFGNSQDEPVAKYVTEDTMSSHSRDYLLAGVLCMSLGELLNN
jgi:hypothetical protein